MYIPLQHARCKIHRQNRRWRTTDEFNHTEELPDTLGSFKLVRLHGAQRNFSTIIHQRGCPHPRLLGSGPIRPRIELYRQAPPKPRISIFTVHLTVDGSKSKIRFVYDLDKDSGAMGREIEKSFYLFRIL